MKSLRHLLTMVFMMIAFLVGCGPKSTLLEPGAIKSSKLKKELGFSVLRAPHSTDENPAAFPVIVFLHGMGSDHMAFDEFGVSSAVFDAMSKGKAPRAHFIFPNGERGFYLNWYDGSHPYEDYILKEVIPRGRAALGVEETAPMHIAGVSMGGIGALQIGLRHPDMFESISSISGVILDRKEANEMMDKLLIKMLAPVEKVWGDGSDEAFSDSINPYELIKRVEPKPKIFLAYGTDEKESIQQTTERFFKAAEAQHLRVEKMVFEGEHTWADWSSVIIASINETVGR